LSAIDPLLERLGLVGGPDAPLRTLSKGNAQKVGLAQAVLAVLGLLILDEPWSGLDAGTHAVLGELVAETRARGASVVFTDHRLAVVRENADAVYRIARGRLTAVADLTDSGPATRIVLAGPGGDWSAEPGVRHAVADGSRVVLTVDATSADAVLLRALSDGWSVREVAPCSP
jgi:ABC-2 type transport system ATP-binding protein